MFLAIATMISQHRAFSRVAGPEGDSGACFRIPGKWSTDMKAVVSSIIGFLLGLLGVSS